MMIMAIKRLTRIALAVALTLAFIPAVAVTSAVPQAYAVANTDTLSITGTERYDMAHEVLAIVNKERQALGLNPLVLDVELTEAAMQRSAELALFFSHTRPNGNSCFTSSAKMRAENIAAGQGGAEAVMQGWFYEERENYLTGNGGQTGHYLNIINPDFKSIGIGCFDGFYWEQAFGTGAASGSVRGDSVEATRSVAVNYGICGMAQSFNRNLNFDSKRSLNVGETFQMRYDIKNSGWEYVYCTIDASNATWKSSNPGVCTVDASGLVTAKAIGTATITATLPSGKSLSHDWRVAESLDDAVIASIPDQTYTGSEIKPLPKVTLGGKTLVKDRDYTVRYVTNSYINLVDARDNVTLIVEGTGNYSGSKSAVFKIVPAKITSATLSQAESVYDGTRKTPTVTVKAGSKTLAPFNYGTGEGDYYVYAPDLVDAGEKTFTIQGRGNYTGTLEVKHTIKPASLASATVSLNQTKFTYDGSWHEPSVTVKMGNETLDDWWDYSVSYPNDAWSVGTKTLTITGRGNYTGSVKATYEIVPASSQDVPSNPSTPSTPSNPSDPGASDNPNAPTQPSNPVPGDSSTPEVATNAMFRLYNPNSGEHFYTASTVERDHLISVGWQDEGTGWTAPAQGDAVYRLYNPYAGEHHYTLSAAERDMLVSVGWNDEGIGWYSDPNQSVPLFRVYNPNEFANNHHYTTSAAERDFLLSLGWQDEGVSWHGV